MKKYPKIPENARSGKSFREILKRLLSVIRIQIAMKLTVISSLTKVMVVFPRPELSRILTKTPELPQHMPESTGKKQR